jgi:hypothetical protein
MHAQLTSQSCSRSSRVLQEQSGHFQGRIQSIRKSQRPVVRAAASSSTAEMTVTGDQQLPAVYKRLVAKRTGTTFTDVAEVEQVPLPVPGANEVVNLSLRQCLLHVPATCVVLPLCCCPLPLDSMLLQTACK